MQGGIEMGMGQRRLRKDVRGRTRSTRIRQDPQIWGLLRSVARLRRLPMGTILDDGRGAAPTYARQLAMYLAHVELGRPQKIVALLFGREASTVSHACQRVELLRDDPAVDAEIETIERAFRNEATRHAH